MSFSFRPRTNEEIAVLRNNLLQPGEYPFIVKDIKPMVSKQMNPMMQVTLEVLSPAGSRHIIIDYLLDTDKMCYKIKHFLESIGLEDKYQKGHINFAECFNRAGKVDIAIQKGQPKPDGSGDYPDKNTVKDYIKLVRVEAKDDFNDEIKF